MTCSLSSITNQGVSGSTAMLLVPISTLIVKVVTGGKNHACHTLYQIAVVSQSASITGTLQLIEEVDQA
jgi:hypothetical protein